MGNVRIVCCVHGQLTAVGTYSPCSSIVSGSPACCMERLQECMRDFLETILLEHHFPTHDMDDQWKDPPSVDATHIQISYWSTGVLLPHKPVGAQPQFHYR